jgi:hypothetical protein
MRMLERAGLLDRAVEYLPDDDGSPSGASAAWA